MLSPDQRHDESDSVVEAEHNGATQDHEQAGHDAFGKMVG